MRKLTLSLAATFMGVALFMSSCIDDSVAPEVAALRQAQIDFLNAQTAFQQAQTRLEQAAAAAQEIQNAYDSANNAIRLEERANDLEADEAYTAQLVAQYEYNLQQQLTNLEEERLDFQQAVDDLSEYIAEHGIDKAQEYLDNYEDTNDDIFDLTGSIITLQNEIEVALAMESGATGSSIGYLISEKQADSVTTAANITDLQAALAVLQAIAVDASVSATALATAKDDSTTEAQQKVTLEAAIINAEEARDLAQAQEDALDSIINKYNTAQGDLDAANAKLDSVNAEIDTANTDISDQNEIIATQTTNLVDLNEILADAQAALAAEEATLALLEADFATSDAAAEAQEDLVEAKQAQVDSIDAEVNVAQDAVDKFNALELAFPGQYETDSIAARAALDAALAEQAILNTELTDLQGVATILRAEATAIDGLVTTQEGEVTTAEGNVDAAQANVDAANQAIDDANTAIAAEQDTLDLLDESIERFTADANAASQVISDCQADYDAAVAGDIQAAVLATQAAQTTVDSLNNELAVVNNRIGVLGNLISTIETNLDDLDQEISDMEDDIDTEEDALENIRIELADLQAEQADAAAILADKQAELASLQDELTALQAVAADWLALLNAELGS